MQEIPAKYQRQIRRYQPIEISGLCLYPVTVDEYEEFSQARQAIEFVQQSLPVTYISMPLLQAYYAVDIESVADQQLPSGLLARAMLFLALALRIGTGESPEARIRRFRIKTSPSDYKRLLSIAYSPDGEEVVEITPITFQRILPILAAQNGITLHDDTENPELLEAESILESKRALDIEISIDALVSGVSALSGVEESDVYDWPILKLQERHKALKRIMDYVICGIAESQGTKWKRGNPAPNPWFPKRQNWSAAAIPMGEFVGGNAQEAVNRALTPSQ